MVKTQSVEIIKERLTLPIVVIGMMGAGKTTLARKLAQQLGCDFYDSDQEIEKDLSLSVRQIFDEKGEAFFRQAEEDKIAILLQYQKSVISVGGGAITSQATASAIFEKSLCLWVDAPVDVLVKRTGHQDSRPLLRGRDAAQVLEEKLAQRRKLYERAVVKIDASLTPDKVVENALGQIAEFLLDKPI